MPLIELLNTTKLRSLGFGHDQLHGGSSSQPYVQTSIPTTKELDKPSPDFLLRGATNADPFLSTGKDLKRLGKWFLSSQGLLFIAKQNLLSRTAVATDVASTDKLLSGYLNGGVYLPTSTLAQVGISAFGLHLNKQGLNPIPSDPNAGRLQNLLDIGSQPLYGKTVYDNSLSGATYELTPIIGSSVIGKLGFNSFGKKVNNLSIFKNVGVQSVSTFNNFLLELHDKRILNGNLSDEIYSYSGGPGSILGVGNTSITFAKDAGGNIIRTNIFPEADGFANGALAYTQAEIFKYGVPYQTIDNGRVTGNNPYSDFRINLKTRLYTYNKDKSKFPYRYKGLNTNFTPGTKIENRTLIGDPGIYSTNATTQAKKRDKLNLLPSIDLSNEKDKRKAQDIRNTYDKDLVTFKIQIINNDTPNEENDVILYFRAFLDGISDAYTSEWDSIQYVGRGEKFYNYKGFDRQISLGWTVSAQSQNELQPMYERLNYLASVCAPDYSANGYMRGNLIKLTIGGYIYEQVGIIKGFSYEMKEEYPWEIGLNQQQPQLSQVIKVNGFQFIPIHSEVPRKGAQVFIHRAIPSAKINTTLGKGSETISSTPNTKPDSQTTNKNVVDPSLKIVVEDHKEVEKINEEIHSTPNSETQGSNMDRKSSNVTNPQINTNKNKKHEEVIFNSDLKLRTAKIQTLAEYVNEKLKSNIK